MKKAQELLIKVTELFETTLDEAAMRRHDYCNNDYKSSLDTFKIKLSGLGLKYGQCYHANGIGNNNEYPILWVTEDEDGFKVEKKVCTFNYVLGIYGGVSACIVDNDGNVVASKGRAR